MVPPQAPGMNLRTDRRLASVVAIDLLVVVGLVLTGMVQHGTIDQPARVVGTVSPFLIGWLVAAPLAGTYAVSDGDGGGFASVLKYRRAAVTWLAAANVGLVLRSAPAFPGGTAWAFPLVITGLGLVALLGWRTVALTVLAR